MTEAYNGLREELYALTDTVAGTVGIAFVCDGDTVTVNNEVRYPMMSVFKLHQALAVAETLRERGVRADSMVHIVAGEMDHDTWSPMLKEYGDGDFDISVAELMRRAIVSSDNNASNLMFRHIVSPKKTGEIVTRMAWDTTFQILYSEDEMKARHTLSYLNYTSPLSAAVLIRRVFGEALTDSEMQDSIKQYLAVVTTGHDRLGAVTEGGDITLFAHKTGSGYRNDAGELMAHNDVGYFQLADGRSYSLAVFIRDFRGSEEEASRIIAGISKCVYTYMMALR